MTPFLALLRARHVTAPTMLLYLYRTSDHAAFLPELQALAASDLKASLCAVATDNKLPDLRTLLADAGALAGQEIYVAGSPGNIDCVRRALHDRGVTARRFHTENELAL